MNTAVLNTPITAPDTNNALTVIVCETSRVQCKIFSKNISDLGFATHAVRTGSEALTLTKCGIGDIVLTGVILPDMSGLELCWELKASKTTQHIQTIVMSTYDDNRRIAEALDSGGDDFIRKPLDKLELQARMRASGRIMRLQKQLYQEANNDALTGAGSRRYFMRAIAEELSKLDNKISPLSVILLDADRFKTVNDTYGHAAGDFVLTHLVETCKNLLDGTEQIGRLGGEEFAIMLPDTGSHEALERAEKIRSIIESNPIHIPDGNQINITVSLGLACTNDYENIPNGAALLKRADMALYEAKHTGRNKVCHLVS